MSKSNENSKLLSCVDEAKRVLSFESLALDELANSLNGDFINAINTIGDIKGRCVVTGMGKSGHVANKIASTFASTGTPSFFVHPGEASHGDLGMISKDDVVIALSNSGETIEMFPIIAYCKRYHIPLISITSKKDSTISKSANCSLVIPKIREACPIGLAPMTSTTMMMALGDAMAASLLKKKEFSPEDFSIFHPGGALGKKLKTVSDIMHVGKEMPIVSPDSNMQESLIEMTSKHFGCVGVVDENKELIGIITDGDLRRHMNNGLLNMSAEKVMTKFPKTLHKKALVEEAVSIMNDKKITNLFITENEYKNPIGIINIHDCLRA